MTGVGGRPEVVIEGSNHRDAGWKEYEFLYKPGSVKRKLPVLGTWVDRFQPVPFHCRPIDIGSSTLTLNAVPALTISLALCLTLNLTLILNLILTLKFKIGGMRVDIFTHRTTTAFSNHFCDYSHIYIYLVIPNNLYKFYTGMTLNMERDVAPW